MQPRQFLVRSFAGGVGRGCQCLHPADYDPVVRMLKEFGAARNRARRLRVGHGGNLRGIVTSRDNGKSDRGNDTLQKARAPIVKKTASDQN
jgi:hypothetical protein